MPQPFRSARRHRRPLLAALAGATLAACDGSDGILPPPTPQAAVLQLVSRNPAPALAGALLPDPILVRALDAQGRPVEGVRVSFGVPGGSSLSTASLLTDSAGYASARWELGSASDPRASVGAEGVPVINVVPRLISVPEVARPMLERLGTYIPTTLENQVLSMPLNPTQTAFFQTKIELLRSPTLGSDILENGRWEMGSITSRAGEQIPIVSLFPVESMRAEVRHYVRYLESGVPVLEAFFDAPFPAPAQGALRMWYGFAVGSSGGGGVISLEDRTTYDARTQGRFAPYDPVVFHELGHSYVGNESLAQFLEVYGSNVLETGSSNLNAWTYTRNWTPQKADNKGLHALLDVYQLIGPEAMARAFRAVVPVRPRYGEPLNAAAQQVFVDAAPAAVRPQVVEKMAKVGF